MIKRRYSRVESLKVMGSASKSVMGPNINVLLWNVFKCRKKGWQDDFISLVRDKDLVLLQEAILNTHLDDNFKKSSKYQWIMARSFRNERTNIETGVKTGSTVAAIKHHFTASVHGEPITKTRKMSLSTEYPLYNVEQSLLVVNSHIINFVSFEKFKAHIDQVFQILQRHEGPVLLAGDFNTWNRKRFEYFDKLAKSYSLEEVELKRQPRLTHLFRNLDHIYSRGLKVSDAKVHININSSDHYPISFALSILKSSSEKTVI